MPNMIHSRRPGAGTKTGRVWEIADEVTRKSGHRARRAEVLSLYAAEGGNPGTGNVQYQEWKTEYEANCELRKAYQESTNARSEPGIVGTLPLNVSADGRLLIPAAMRDAMLLDEDGAVTASVIDGELRVISPMAAIRQAQKIAQKYKKPDESVVDEFLAERRAMWGEE